MTSSKLIAELKKNLPEELAEDLVNCFITVRIDLATGTLERAGPGKFVETVVQVLQHLATGSYSQSFKSGEVDDFLKNSEARTLNLPEELRILVTRVARGMYALRSKRGIIHKSGIDPNIYDLRYLYYAAQWVLCEIICHVLSIDIDSARELIDFIQIPANSNVEDFGDKRLVLSAGTAMEELLSLLLYYYPECVMVTQLKTDMNRRAKSTVSNTITSAYNSRLIEGDSKRGYKLTVLGYQQANNIVRKTVMASVDS